MILAKLFTLLLLLAFGAAEASSLTNQDVMDLVQAGVSEATIAEAVETSDAKFDTSAGALIALKNAGASDVLLQKIIRKSATGSRSTGVPVEEQGRREVEVTVRGISRGGQLGYRLTVPGYLQMDLEIRNASDAPIQYSGSQITAAGVALTSLYAAQIVPIGNTDAVGVAGVAGALAGVPMAGVGAALVSRFTIRGRAAKQKSLDALLLRHGTISPGTSATGMVAFRDPGATPDTLIANYFGGSSGLQQQSVVVPLNPLQER